jgi:8-oxo-dGTP pyrophosphatase MutT (NUDIX family)
MAHIHEKIDWVINAFIVHKDRVLFVDHIQARVWLPIGGHVELDEDPEEALHREVREECGLNVEIIGSRPGVKTDGTFKMLVTPQFLDIHNTSTAGHKHIALNYICKAGTDRVRLSPEEHHDIKWFNKEEIEKHKNIPYAIRFYALEALKACAKN